MQGKTAIELDADPYFSKSSHPRFQNVLKITFNTFDRGQGSMAKSSGLSQYLLNQIIRFKAHLVGKIMITFGMTYG